jgi:hypothetical protein
MPRTLATPLDAALPRDAMPLEVPWGQAPSCPRVGSDNRSAERALPQRRKAAPRLIRQSFRTVPAGPGSWPEALPLPNGQSRPSDDPRPSAGRLRAPHRPLRFDPQEPSQSQHPFGVHQEPFVAQPPSLAAVPFAGELGGQPSDPIHELLRLRSPTAVARARTVARERTASAPFAHRVALPEIGSRLAPGRGRHHFRDTTSRSIRLSSVSVSSARRRSRFS